MSTRRILISLAHPDDESFGLGGLTARYVDEGAEVYLICTTNGDVGTVSPELLEGYKSISELRLAELECASQVLGFTKVFTFGYKDSGMMDSDTNAHPNCSWYVWNNRPEELIQRVIEVIREVKPQVIITFNRYGAYGHPDHIAIQRATVEAFHKASDPTYTTDDLEPFAPQKLYYTTIPSLMIRIGVFLMRIKGQNPRQVGTNKDIDLIAVLENSDPIHTKVEVRKYLDIWDQANACHHSQGGSGVGGIVPRWLRKIFGVKQSLTRIYPVPSQNRVDETDVFSGVHLD